MRVFMTWLLIGAAYFGGCANAVTLDGAWKFERSADYYGRTPVNQAPAFSTLLIHDSEVRLAEGCVVKFAKEQYLFPDVFQPLSKGGVSEKQLDAFLLKKLNLSLSKAKEVYSLADASASCARPMMEFFLIGHRIVVPGGGTFYIFVKSAADSPSEAMPSLYRLSRFPMDQDRYYAACIPKMLDAKGQPHTTDKCAPEFFPYVADPKSSDTLMKLIGNHDYAKMGQQYTEGFSPPFAQKIPATFLVFPSFKQVIVVRVDDLARVRNEERDVMSPAYLSVVDGKIVDQISGCSFNRDYVCTDGDRPIFKLTETGKFQPIK